MADDTKKLRYITDEAANTDDFGTHANIATTLLDTIADNDIPMTIGLEGSWGSGKSTVVNLMFEGIEKGVKGIIVDTDNILALSQQKYRIQNYFLEEEQNHLIYNSTKIKIDEKWKNIEYFYIDVWQHEHSCIKRAILHEMIDKLLARIDIPSIPIFGKERDKYNTLKSIEDRIKGSSTKTYITHFSLILALGVVVIPIIAAFIGNVDFDKLSLNPENGINFNILWSLILLVISVAIISIQALRNNRDGITERKDKNNRGLLTEQIGSTFNNSSIEFSQYFGDLLNIINEENSKKKTLIVFDNLDRIDETKAKEMWAELQVFMQYRNPGATDEEKEERPWIIIPYDIDGIRKIWGNDNDKVKSFIDKTFNLRLHVPKQITSSWNAYLDIVFDKTPEYIPKVEHQSLEESQKNGDYFDDDKIYTTLKQVIEFNDLNEYNTPPSPREIKDMYNILLIYRDLLCRIKGHEIALEALCFYVYHTVRKSYLSGSGKILEMKYSDYDKNKMLSLQRQFSVFLDSDYVTHIHAIDYHLGLAATLEKDILQDVTEYHYQDDKDEALERLKAKENDYPIIFWRTFDLYLSISNNFEAIIKYSTVLNYFRKEKPSQFDNVKKCINHINKMYRKTDDTIACDQVGLDYLELLHENKVKEENVNLVNEILDAYKRYITQRWHGIGINSNLEGEIPKYFEVFSLAKKISPDFRISIYYRTHDGLVRALFESEYNFSTFFEVYPDKYFILHDDIVYHPSDINQCDISQIVLYRLFTETYSEEDVTDLKTKVLSILDFAVNKTDQHNNYREFVMSIWNTISLLESEKKHRNIFFPFIKEIINSKIHWQLIDKLIDNEEFTAPKRIERVHKNENIDTSSYYEGNTIHIIEAMIKDMNEQLEQERSSR